MSGSWDATVRTWDPRLHQAKEQGRASVPGKVFAMTLGGEWYDMLELRACVLLLHLLVCCR